MTVPPTSSLCAGGPGKLRLRERAIVHLESGHLRGVPGLLADRLRLRRSQVTPPPHLRPAVGPGHLARLSQPLQTRTLGRTQNCAP